MKRGRLPKWSDLVHAADSSERAMCRPVAPRRETKLATERRDVTCDLCRRMQETAEYRLGYMQGRGAS